MIFSEPSIGIKNKKQTVILYDCPLVVTSDNDVCRADAFAIFCSDARVYVARRRRTNDGPSVIKRSLSPRTYGAAARAIYRTASRFIRENE